MSLLRRLQRQVPCGLVGREGLEGLLGRGDGLAVEEEGDTDRVRRVGVDTAELYHFLGRGLVLRLGTDQVQPEAGNMTRVDDVTDSN